LIETGIFPVLALALAGFCFSLLGRRRRVTPTSYRGGGIIVALVAPLPGSAHRIRIGVAAGCPGDIRVTQVRRGDRNPRFDSCQQQVFLEVEQ
jgi:hypothetical protein